VRGNGAVRMQGAPLPALAYDHFRNSLH
jgi:hypothetical protein